MKQLDILRPLLDSIPAQEVREPDLPMAVALQEAHDLDVALATHDGWARLVAVGLDPAVQAALPGAIAATRQAQSQWVVLRDRHKPRAQHERELRGEALRRELVTACRWNLRREPEAARVLGAVMQGEGMPDLVQDLQDLAQLVERHQPRFAADETFDAPTQAEAARSLAAQIAEAIAQSRSDRDDRDAKLLRDRAFTYLDSLVTDIRTAGRYAFRDQPPRLAMFSSQHRRRQRRAARRREEAPARPQPRLTE